MRSNEVNNAAKEINSLAAAAEKWRGELPTFTGVNMAALNTAGLLPSELQGTGMGANPWGGNISVESDAAYGIIVTLTSVPPQACAQLAQLYANVPSAKAACDSDLVTVNFSENNASQSKQ